MKVDKLLRQPDNQQFKDEIAEDWDAGQNEAALANDIRDMYRAETTVYNRLVDIQGKTVPRVMASVELGIAPGEVGLNDRQRRHFQMKGMLLQYIPGFSRRDLGIKVPRGSWQAIVDQAVEMARSLGNHGVLNKDVRPDNFIVSGRAGDGDSLEGFKVVMIDFGQSRVRRDDESDFDWGRTKWR